MSTKKSNKKLSVPVLKDQALFDMISGSGITRRLGLFGSPGSVPATKAAGWVNQYPDIYDYVDDFVLTATLKFVSLAEFSFVGAGIIMENAETGARYLMLDAEFKHMLEHAVFDHNQIQGQWDVIKEGHAYSLRWITPKVDPEQRHQG